MRVATVHEPASAPSRPGCQAGCWADTTDCALGRRRGLPPRSRPTRRRSTGSRPGSSGVGSCPDPQTGTSGGYCSPEAAQCTTIEGRASGTTPSSRMISRRVTCLMCPRRTTLSMVRSRSSSHIPMVGVLAIVGRTSLSILSITPTASSRGRDRRANRRRRPWPWCQQQAREPPRDRAGRRSG